MGLEADKHRTLLVGYSDGIRMGSDQEEVPCPREIKAGSNVLQTGWLKPQKLIFSRFWMLEGQDQDAGKVGFL